MGKTDKQVCPALSPEARQNQLVSMAMDEAEYLMKNHKASGQVITHFLKLGCMKSELELEKLRNENAVLNAKAEAIKSMKSSEELYAKALDAMRTYSGHGGDTNE